MTTTNVMRRVNEVLVLRNKVATTEYLADRPLDHERPYGAQCLVPWQGEIWQCAFPANPKIRELFSSHAGAEFYRSTSHSDWVVSRVRDAAEGAQVEGEPVLGWWIDEMHGPKVLLVEPNGAVSRYDALDAYAQWRGGIRSSMSGLGPTHGTINFSGTAGQTLVSAHRSA